MKTELTICCVVVTFNRIQLLLECLAALRHQSYKLDAIYIVDNASTDKTPEILKASGYISTLPPININEPWETTNVISSDNQKKITIFYLRLPENTGGAGGFYWGVKRGFERSFDWLWLMDDDVEPFEDGLEHLMEYAHISKCIQPSRCFLDGRRFSWGSVVDKNGKFSTIDEKVFENKNYIEVNTGCFEGMLIHRDIISKIGFPEKQLFMVGDDTLYGWLASCFTKVIYIKDVCLTKKLPPKMKKTPISEYLYFRNNYYLLKKISNNSFSVRLNYFLKVLNKFLSRLIKYKSKDLAFSVLKGYIDAIRNDFSNDFLKKLLQQNR